jgi:hypothetical protein
MQLEEKLTALLQTICPSSFPDYAPANTVVPYVIWQQIGGEAPDFLDQALPNKRNGWVQIEVWCTTRAAASALMLQIEAALIAATNMQATPMAALTNDFDSDTGRRGCRQDFNIWADR